MNQLQLSTTSKDFTLPISTHSHVRSKTMHFLHYVIKVTLHYLMLHRFKIHYALELLPPRMLVNNERRQSNSWRNYFSTNFTRKPIILSLRAIRAIFYGSWILIHASKSGRRHQISTLKSASNRPHCLSFISVQSPMYYGTIINQ